MSQLNNSTKKNCNSLVTIDKPDSLTIIDKTEPSDLHMTKCYRCSSYQVEAVCHHCGRFLCKRCVRKTSGWLFVDNAFAHLHPLIDSRLRHGAHCEDCFHRDLQAWPIVALSSSLLAIVLLWVVWPQFNGTQRGLFIGSAVITITLVSWGLYRWLPLWVTYPEGFLPLLSRTKIEIQERVQANFHITGDDYLSPSPTATGHIDVTLAVGPNDQARYESAPQPKQPLKIQAGFVALEGLKNVEFCQYSGIRRHENLLQLVKTMTAAELKDVCHSSDDLSLKADYHIYEEALQVGLPHDKEFPLLIKPRRANGGYRLDIIFELLKKKVTLKYAKDGSEKTGEDDKGIVGKPILESLEVHIPPQYRNKIEESNGHHDKQAHVVRWHRQRLDVTETSPYRAYIQFRNILGNGIDFEGTYKIVIDDWTISQLHITPEGKQPKDRFIIRPANGLRLSSDKNKNEEDKKKWLAPIVKHRTEIEGKLHFNTKHLFSQQIQMASDSSTPDNQNEIRGKEELLVAPTHHVINAVVEELTDKEIFIKNVTETLGDVKETETGSHRAKYWEIIGKYFVQGTLQPVHLHLVILGEGAQSYRPNCEGVSSFELCLRSYVEMTDLIKNPDWLKGEYCRLKDIIKIAAYQGRQVDYKGRRILAEQREKQFERMLRQRYAINGNSELSVVLTGDHYTYNMFIFIAPSTISKKLDGIPGDIIFSRSHLPKIDGRWIDKWELLKDAEMRLKNG